MWTHRLSYDSRSETSTPIRPEILASNLLNRTMHEKTHDDRRMHTISKCIQRTR